MRLRFCRPQGNAKGGEDAGKAGLPMISQEEAAVIARAEKTPAYMSAREVLILVDVIHRQTKDAKEFADKLDAITKATEGTVSVCP